MWSKDIYIDISTSTKMEARPSQEGLQLNPMKRLLVYLTCCLFTFYLFFQQKMCVFPGNQKIEESSAVYMGLDGGWGFQKNTQDAILIHQDCQA